MNQEGTGVSMGTWVGVWKEADIRCRANAREQEVLVSFGDAEFELTLSRAAVERCVELFHLALIEMDASTP